jgi:hypothetical protein
MMVRRQPTITDVLVVLGIGIVCLPLFFTLMPYFEESRTEARRVQAYIQVQQLGASRQTTTAPDIAEPTIELPDVDPWGQHYRLVPLGGNQMRVLSSGPNMSTPANGPDEDDIYSDMPTSPMELIRAGKDRQWIVAFVATAGAWFVFTGVYVRSRFFRTS